MTFDELRPHVVEKLTEHPRVRLHLRLPVELPCFRGHFPDAPVVPGFMQLYWAVAFANEELGTSTSVAGVEALKFRRVIPPDTDLVLDIRFAEDAGKLHFEFTADGERMSVGRVVLE